MICCNKFISAITSSLTKVLAKRATVGSLSKEYQKVEELSLLKKRLSGLDYTCLLHKTSFSLVGLGWKLSPGFWLMYSRPQIEPGPVPAL